MGKTVIKNARIVSDNRVFEGDLLFQDGLIQRIDSSIDANNADVVDANGSFVLPGVIDDQVHFREPGLTHKASIFAESRAALAGGTTSYMEMPNVNPQTVTNLFGCYQSQFGRNQKSESEYCLWCENFHGKQHG